MTLESKEIPNRWWRVKGAGLDTGAQLVLQAVLDGFLKSGEPPAPPELRRVAETAGITLEAALAELVRHDMVVTDESTGAILGAYPFSGLPTMHQVAIEGLATVYAMCAVDALGIPFMVDRAVTITSLDPASGEPLRIQIEPALERVVADPPGIVVLAGTSGSEGTAAACRCPFINFFRSSQAAAAYQGAHPKVLGQLLSLDDAVTYGRRVFEDPDGLVTA